MSSCLSDERDIFDTQKISSRSRKRSYKLCSDFKEVSRLTVLDGEMQKKTVVKSKLSQINYKRFYFADGITSSQLSHPHLHELVDFKVKKGQGIEQYFWEENETLLEIENRAQKSNESLFL